MGGGEGGPTKNPKINKQEGGGNFNFTNFIVYIRAKRKSTFRKKKDILQNVRKMRVFTWIATILFEVRESSWKGHLWVYKYEFT